MTPSTYETEWLSCPQPDPSARLRLFLLPYAGGASAMFRRWLPDLPPGVEAWLVHLPGREKRFRQPPIDGMGPLVAALTGALAPLVDMPFAFFGHSMGAMIAYEVARELRRRGQPSLSHLFVSGRGAPEQASGVGRLYALPNEELMDQLRRLDGTPRAVLENQDLIGLFLPLLRADFAVVDTYAWTPEPPLACPITAFGGTDDPAWTADKVELWRHHTSGPFKLHILSGNHFFLHTAQAQLLQLIGEGLAPPSRTAEPTKVWQAVNEVPELPADVVHVWRTPLEQPKEYLEALNKTLSLDERQRAERFYFEKDRRHFVAGRGILRALLARYLRRDPAALEFAYNPQGKPTLAGGAGDLRFNLAHSHGLALVAVAQRREVGVDLERIRPEFAGDQVAERFFSPAEVAALRTLAEDQRQDAFFACWTRKEAYMKATGKGLSLGLDCFEVSVIPGQAALLSTRHDPSAANRWSLCDLVPGPGYAGALAVEGRDWGLWCADWPGPAANDTNPAGSHIRTTGG
jgi:medium-chain acyl-[acyl-carrier-protein] hydrolase